MKNKLSSEEQSLHSKLNEAEFAYQESDWKQIETAVAKKGFLANYGTFFKAAVAFVVLTTAVYLVNTKYSKVQEPKIQTAEKQESSTRLEIAIEPAEVEATNSENIPIQEIIASQVVETDKENLIAGVKELKQTKVDHKGLVVKKSTALETINEPEEIINKELSPNLDYLNINILSSTCINSLIEFEGEYVTSLEEDLNFKWLIDGKVIKGSQLKNTYTFTSEGMYELTFIIVNEEEILGKFSKTIKINPVETIDFKYEDISNPFYDNNVRLIAINPQPGEYMWYFNKYNDRVQFNKITAWWFEHPGTYQMNLDYTNENGCTATATKTVVMEKQFTQRSFPNVFSPHDRDGINDEFMLEALQPYTFSKFSLTILDMNGQQVFNTNDKNQGWNGRLNNTSGNILSGFFAWQVEIENNNSNSRTFRGKVQIREF